MRVERQLSLILENRPGVLAAVCADLGKNKINIEAVTVANLVDHSVVRLVVNDADKAIHLLGAAGVLVFENEVVAVSADNKPGALADIAERLGKARVNIDYMYASTPRPKGKAMIYLRVSNAARAQKALESYR
jgi:hypothetical protein